MSEFPSVETNNVELVLTWLWFFITLCVLLPIQSYYLFLYYKRSNLAWFDKIDTSWLDCGCVQKLENLKSRNGNGKENEIDSKMGSNLSNTSNTNQAEIDLSNSNSNRIQRSKSHVGRSVSSPYLRTRHPELVVITMISFTIWLAIERNASLLLRTQIYDELWLQILRLYVLFPISTFFATSFICLRYWLIYYDTNLGKAAESKRWKILLRLSSRQESLSFFEKYHTTLGSYGWLMKRLSICVSLLILLVIIMYVEWDDFEGPSIVNAIILFPLVVFTTIIYWRTPVFHDEFRITDEAKYSSYFLIGLTLYYFGYNVITAAIGHDSWGFWFSLQIVSTTFPFINSMISTYWVLKIEDKMTSTNMSDNNDNINNNNNNNEDQIQTSLEDVLTDDRGFEGFMSHLAHEFSMENLLSVVEMTQYQQFIIDWHKKEIEERSNQERRNHVRSDSLRVRVSSEPQKQYSILPDFQEMESNSPKSPSLQVPGMLHEAVHGNENDNTEETFDGLADLAMKLSVSDENILGDNNNNNDQTQTKSQSSKDNLRTKLTRLGSHLPKPRHSQTDNELSPQLIGLVIIQLPNHQIIPKSSIVWDDFENDKLSKTVQYDKDSLKARLIPMAIALFEKYIETNSEFELNLSSRLRKSAMKKKEKLKNGSMTDEEIYHIFDKIIKAMMKLMIDSFVRFKLTQGFKSWEQHFLRKDNIRNAIVKGNQQITALAAAAKDKIVATASKSSDNLVDESGALKHVD